MRNCRSWDRYSCLSTVATSLLAEPFNARDSLRIILSNWDPAEEIMKVAAQEYTDMIGMGAKGVSAIERTLLGSVSIAGGAVRELPGAGGSIRNRQWAYR